MSDEYELKDAQDTNIVHQSEDGKKKTVYYKKGKIDGYDGEVYLGYVAEKLDKPMEG